MKNHEGKFYKFQVPNLEIPNLKSRKQIPI